MKSRYVWLGIALLLSAGASAQSVDSLLAGVAARNKTLRSQQGRAGAAALQYKVGNTLPDPKVEYEYMKGYPATAGAQNDLTVIQSLDFPTAYGKRKAVAHARTEQLGFEQEVIRQGILLEAKQTAIEVIYLNRRIAELQQRQVNTEQFFQDYQKKYDKEDATVLDLQKARLQLVNIRTELKMAETRRKEYLQRLTESNGGQSVNLPDTLYPVTPSLPDFDTLHNAIDAVNPERKFYEAQVRSGETELGLTKALTLPKLEVGYRYQGILGQRFHGGHIGVSVPLWENRHKREAQQLQTQYYNAQLEEHHTAHYSEIRQLYDQATSLDSTLTGYREALSQLNNEPLLRKSLNAGQMNTLQYYVELTLLYESRDKFLELEKEYHKVMAALFRHTL